MHCRLATELLYVSVAWPSFIHYPTFDAIHLQTSVIHTIEMANKPTYAAVAANEASPTSPKTDAPHEAPPPCKSLQYTYPFVCITQIQPILLRTECDVGEIMLETLS